MKARILNICLAVLLIAVGYVWGNRSLVRVDAQEVPAYVSGRTFNAPRAWGRLVGGNDKALIFEDSLGVIRVVNAFGAQVEETLNRQ